MRSIQRLPGVLPLVALLGLSACATYNPAYGGLPFPLPGGDDRYDRRGDYGDYRNSSEWRRVDGDAARYANEVDRAIRLSSGEERAVSRVVRDRARNLLQRTHPRDHRYVYPFPRYRNEGDTRSWWDQTDRAVERVLSSRSRRAYRDWVRGDYSGRDGYYGDDGYYNRDRRDDDYRGRRYEEPDYRRNDDRGNRGSAGRAAAGRNPVEILRRQNEARRQADARRRDDVRRREEEARRQAANARRQDDVRREQVRRQTNERRQDEARQEQGRRREQASRQRQQVERQQQAERQRRESPRRQEAGRDERRSQRGRSEQSRDDSDARSSERTEQNDDRERGRRARPQRGN